MAVETRTQNFEELLVALNEKLDHLNAEVAQLRGQVAEMQRRQQAWEDLQEDLGLVMRDAYEALSQELAELEPYVTLEDVWHLLKRLLRNVHNLEYLLEQLESLRDLQADAGPVVHEAVESLIEFLDELEKKGYFAFFRESLRIIDNIVTNYTPEDVRLLADNIVIILNTVRELTQPDIMELLQEIADTYREVQVKEGEVDISTLGLLRQMRDPHVRRGLALTMQMLRLISLHRAKGARNGQSPEIRD